MNKFFVLSLALVLLAGAYAADEMTTPMVTVSTSEGETMMTMNIANATTNSTMMNSTMMNSTMNSTVSTQGDIELNSGSIFSDITGLGTAAAAATGASLGSLAFNGSMLAGSANNASNWINTVVNATVSNFNVTNPTWNSTFTGLDSNITNMVNNLTLANIGDFSGNLSSEVSSAYNMTKGFISNEGETLQALLNNSTDVISEVASQLNTVQAEAAAGFIAYEAGAFLGVLAGNLANDANTGDFSKLGDQVSSFDDGVADAASVFYNGTNLNSSVSALLNAVNSSMITDSISNDVSNLTNYANNVSDYASNLTNVSVSAIPAALLSSAESVYNVSECFNASCKNQSNACMMDSTCNTLMMQYQACLSSCSMGTNYTFDTNTNTSVGSINAATSVASSAIPATSGFLSALSTAAVDETANLLGASNTSPVSCFQSCFNPSNYADNALFTAYLTCGVTMCA